ncbi:sulfite exporter TauE/SafE family protein [Hydrogenophilus thiooxidans]|uniref:sulfite exporter TauE/SafE family protein n=1 Tax=Hydrogenophilus thiooxidans TaxID=2820326 RepID=UPI003211B651
MGVAAFAAGSVDAAVGGGGLIQIPALLLGYPNQPLPNLFGTNKIASVFGTSVAAFRYVRRVSLSLTLLVGVVIAAAVGSAMGASAVTLLPQAWVKPIVLLLLCAVAVYTFRRKEMGLVARAHPLTRRELRHALGWSAVIGAYDGFLGPGTGSFLIFAFIRFLRFDFLQASALAKVANVSTNLAAIALFSWQAQPIWLLGLWMAVCNVAGSLFGTWWAFRFGSVWLRRLFLGVVSLTILRLSYDWVIQ